MDDQKAIERTNPSQTKTTSNSAQKLHKAKPKKNKSERSSPQFNANTEKQPGTLKSKLKGSPNLTIVHFPSKKTNADVSNKKNASHEAIKPLNPPNAGTSRYVQSRNVTRPQKDGRGSQNQVAQKSTNPPKPKRNLNQPPKFSDPSSPDSSASSVRFDTDYTLPKPIDEYRNHKQKYWKIATTRHHTRKIVKGEIEIKKNRDKKKCKMKCSLYDFGNFCLGISDLAVGALYMHEEACSFPVPLYLLISGNLFLVTAFCGACVNTTKANTKRANGETLSFLIWVLILVRIGLLIWGSVVVFGKTTSLILLKSFITITSLDLFLFLQGITPMLFINYQVNGITSAKELHFPMPLVFLYFVGLLYCSFFASKQHTMSCHGTWLANRRVEL